MVLRESTCGFFFHCIFSFEKCLQFCVLSKNLFVIFWCGCFTVNEEFLNCATRLKTYYFLVVICFLSNVCAIINFRSSSGYMMSHFKMMFCRKLFSCFFFCVFKIFLFCLFLVCLFFISFYNIYWNRIL